MKSLLLIATLLILSALPIMASAGTQRINLNFSFDSDVLVIKNKTVNIRAHCIQDDSITHQSILRIYTKAIDSSTTRPAKIIQAGLDSYNGSASFLTSATLEEKARLLELTTTPGIFIATTPDSGGGFVIDIATQGPKGFGIAFSAGSAAMIIDDTQGCFLSLSMEKISTFKTPPPPK